MGPSILANKLLLLGSLLLSPSNLLPSCSASALPNEFIFQPSKLGDKGAVACESRECTRVGLDLLAQGGNAVDAMVGTQLCIGVIGMYHSGIGGGGFALVRDAEGNYETIDFRESAPAAAYENMYKNRINDSIHGGLAAGVPSELRGLDYMHQKYGKLSWEKVAMPSSLIAREGFAVTADTVGYMNRAVFENGVDFFLDDPEWAKDFAPNGTRVGLGDTMTRERYADTLERIAKEGVEPFYTGDLAESFVKTVRDTGGIMTADDLALYEVIPREALNITYRDYRLFSTGVPASGAICLKILKILEQYDPQGSSPRDVGLDTHRLDEAMRFAYGARVLLGDPDYVDGMTAYEADIISESAAQEIRGKILDSSTQPVHNYNPHQVYATDSFGTTHVVTADESGLAVSLTSTVNLLFGNLVVDPRTGVILNNEMNDFSIPGVRNAFGFEPSPANFVRPGKRPLSSINPVIIERPDGSLHSVVGAAGGSRITSSTAQTVWHVLEHGMTMNEAVMEPRVHDQLLPNEAWFEWKFDNATVESMRERGHDVKWVAEGLSAVQGIRVLEGGAFEAAGEPRQGNSAGMSL